MRRVLITGLGIVGPTGVGRDRYWTALLAGESGIGPLSRFDATGYPCRIAGEVRDLSFEAALPPRLRRTTAFATRLALGAGALALADARLALEIYDPSRRGVILGTALGGWSDAEAQYDQMRERGPRRVNPFVANGTPNHTPGVELAGVVGARGPQATFTSGCPSSLQAIALGAALVRAGTLDVCLAGGVEAPVTRLAYAGLSRTGELSTRNDDPAAASRPFDVAHDGLVPSEGACVLVLEAEEAVARRAGGDALASVLGSGASCDGAGQYEMDVTGEAGAHALRAALAEAGVQASDIAWVCSHANGLPSFDRKESAVLRRVLDVDRVRVSSIKGTIGHPFGAAGAFQSATAALAIRHALVPPTRNFHRPDPACALRVVGPEPEPLAVAHALVTSYGYGGVNAALVLGAA